MMMIMDDDDQDHAAGLFLTVTPIPNATPSLSSHVLLFWVKWKSWFRPTTRNHDILIMLRSQMPQVGGTRCMVMRSSSPMRPNSPSCENHPMVFGVPAGS